jgi:drug/metabolite transporter (DMT)-like permease
MFPAILTTMLFALSAASAGRTTRLLGGGMANFARLVLATLWLGFWAYAFGQGTGGPSFHWFLLSGVIGFGVGDLGLYAAYPRLGARLAVLLSQCLAAPFGAVAERLWLGTALSSGQILWGTVTLAGVALALWPDSRSGTIPRGHWLAGTVFGIIAAVGQGGGAVITRKAYAVANQAGFHVDGGTAAFQRIIGGISLTVLVLLLYRVLKRGAAQMSPLAPGVVRDPRTLQQVESGPYEVSQTSRRWRQAWPWVVVNSLSGPAIGVACYQWALAIAPTGVVLPIVALTPLAVIPFTLVMEGERPSLQSMIGGAIAVLGAVALTQA